MNEVTVDYAIQFLLANLMHLMEASRAVTVKQAEGRKTFTKAEWDVITGGRDAAIAKLDADIAADKGG